LAVSQLNDEVEERREERDEAGCNLAAGLGTRTKKICERDK